MADVKISQLPAATTPVAGTEVLPIVQGGTTSKVAISDLTAGRAVSMTSATVAAGAVGTPSITTAGDTNTGIYFPAADTIAFVENGVEAMRITSAGKTGFATAAPAATVHVAGDTILSNVNVLGASYDSVSFSVAGEELTPTDLFFRPDGLRMYVVGSTGDDVNEYNLSTAWVVSSAVYSTVFSVASQDLTPQGLFFRADGTKMYVLGATNDTVFQYTLSTPWSVATASYDSISFSVAAEETTPTGIFFKPNGLSMYVVGNANDAVYQYTLSTAWNVSTATFLQSFAISGQEATSVGMAFTGDGSRMFITGSTGDDVNVYNLTTPWDISTSAFVNVFSVAGQDTAPQGIYIKPDGTKMYIVGSTNDAVFQYTVPSIDIQLTGPTSVACLDVQQDLTVYGTGAFTNLINSGNVGIGTSSPGAKLDVGTAGNVAGGNILLGIKTNNANKYSQLCASQYANTTYPEGFTLIGSETTASTNSVFLGGFFASNKAATDIRFFTAGNNTTNNGTERARINSSGNVGIGTSSPSASAILDVQSTTKGVRMPNMTTTEKNAIGSPAAGLMIFDTTLAKLCVYTGSAWQTITSI